MQCFTHSNNFFLGDLFFLPEIISLFWGQKKPKKGWNNVEECSKLNNFLLLLRINGEFKKGEIVTSLDHQRRTIYDLVVATWQQEIRLDLQVHRLDRMGAKQRSHFAVYARTDSTIASAQQKHDVIRVVSHFRRSDYKRSSPTVNRESYSSLVQDSW